MTVSYASHISASVTKEKRAFFCPSAPAPCGVGIFTKEMKVGSETVTGAGRQCPDKLMRAYSHLENGSTIFLYRKDRPLVSIRPDVPAPPQPTEPSNSVSSSVESDACPSEPAVATSAVAPQVEEALIGRAVQTSEETSSLKPPSAPPNTAFPAKNDLWYTVPQLQLGEERDVEVRPKWARLAGCGIPEEPWVATSEETSSLKPPSAPPNAAFPTKNDLWYTVPKLQLGEERDVDVRPKWARLAGFPEEPRVATSEETSSLKLPSAPPNAAFPTKNDLWYTVPKLQLGEERDVDVRPKWARLAGFPEEPRVATSEETSSLKLPSAPPNAAFPTKNDLWYTVPLCTTDKKDVDSDLYHHKREDIMETETSLSERAETLVFDLVRLSGSGSVSAEFQFKVGLTLVRFAETSRLACRLARETMDRWIFRLQREGRWGRKLKDLSRFIVRFPTVFASPSDLDQEDFPMEDLSLDEENEDHPLPVPVVAPVPEEPRVAALPSPAPVSAPVPEEPRFAALPSPAPVSAPVPEEPRVAALPSPAPVSAPVPEEPRVSALHSPAPVSAPVPEEPWVVALPSPAPVSAPVPVEPRVASLHSPAPVSAPVPEELRVAALPSPAPVSAPVPVEPRVAALPSPAPVSAPFPEEPRVAALPSPAPVSAPVPEEPRVAALPSPDPVSAPFPEEPRVAALPSPAPVSAPFPEEPRVAALPSPMSAQQNNEDVFVDMKVDYNSVPQSSPPHDLPVRQAAPLLPSPRKRRAGPTQVDL
ncbi:uncharacterized protein [Misgurnus anguillicaudatus]|uniref:uncharacterized protein n=1 Tax=Misgurnus anguillicaudatus TaxID=75329 RepID=UPI003CCF36B4